MEDDAGAPLAGAASQRRTLALLAVLALAPDGGLSRDKLVALLWPEAESERARHSLTQALYAARRALQADDLFVLAGADVRLNPERMGSDVRELEALLDAGELERAVELYTGPFLDGFYLSGSAEFEQWSSAQRDRLQGRVIDALQRLAAGAEDARDPRRALEWRRRLATLIPLDAGNAARLMTAMAEVGDRAGAIQHARVHASLLREELDLDPDPMVEGLAARLRDGSWVSERRAPDAPVDGAASIVAPLDLAHREAPAPSIEGDPAAPALTPAGPVRDWPPVARRVPSRWMRLGVLALVLLGLVGTGVMIGRAGRASAPHIGTLAVRQRVVVAPFRVAGADPSLAYLRDGMVELLSTRLADDTAARSVDAGAVLGAWRAAGLASSMDVPRDTVVTLATKLGAERVVVGSVVGTPARAVLSATVLQLPRGTVSAQASVSGPADSITTLIDRLAARLLVSEAGQDESLEHYTSRSLPALRAYLAGQAAFRRGDYASALRQYDQALRRDSTFALAALYKALTADRLGRAPALRAGVALAWDARADLNERDQALLVALAGPRYPALSTAAEQAAAWQHVVDLSPASADAWHALGTRLLKDGPSAGMSDARSRADAALQRALAIDPSHAEARRLVEQLAGRGDSLATRRAHGANRVELLLAEHDRALEQGRTADALEATTRLRRLQPGDAWLRLRVLDRLYADGDSAAAEEAARRLVEITRAAPPSVPVTWDGWLADACVVAQWRLARGDTTGVRGTVELLRARAIGPTVPVSATSAACAELLDAALAVATRSRDARARVLRLDSLVFTPQVAGEASAWARVAIGRLRERLGDRGRAGAS